MFSYLNGIVKEKGQQSLVLESGPLGWRIFVSSQSLASLKLGEKVKLFLVLRLKMQEGELELYGFKTEEEKALFELLITIDKIGPKTALNILSSTSFKKLKTAISGKKVEFLTRVAGLGEKTANRIVLELAKKVKNLSQPDTLDLDVQLEEALVSLGFAKKDIKKVMAKLEDGSTDLNQHLKKALSLLKNA